MITKPAPSRQSHREVWTCERLVRECALAISCAIEPTSYSSYSSALTSYLDFCSSHSFPIEPTSDTLSFYAVYMSHYIKPLSVRSYLSGICSQLEPFFPDVRTHRRHWLLALLSQCLSLSPSYDNLLFLTLTLTGFHGLLRLDYRKVILRNNTTFNSTSFQFLLPGHKADRFFEGSQVIIQKTTLHDDPLSPFLSYLSGATALAEAGLPPHIIQAISRWNSDMFHIYIRRHPVILASFSRHSVPFT
ncbi:hypothetical protein BYT27DRAFT_7223801 [Phlegmacium glaucopus]|nr:hypothetical protein BYT27DRAFT_7223801 [Phlegmacium glaucopus]